MSSVVTAVGACSVCGVRFDAAEEVAGVAADLLRLHALVCDGGDRTGVVVVPFAAVAPPEPEPVGAVEPVLPGTLDPALAVPGAPVAASAATAGGG